MKFPPQHDKQREANAQDEDGPEDDQFHLVPHRVFRDSTGVENDESARRVAESVFERCLRFMQAADEALVHLHLSE
jgi:hypothetical protein